MIRGDDHDGDDRDRPRLYGQWFRVAVVVERTDDGPDECTLYPATASGTELATTWITASEGGFVSLSSCR